ncbi:hypothetical protein PLCT2_02847 [Planctomycetaceae bacterium]|nr:hypothetical protein PLCT2_02847 [Planctomycetaceae bacterium]
MGLRGKTWLWVLLACYAGGLALTIYEMRDERFNMAQTIAVYAVLPFIWGSAVFLPYGFIVLGIAKLRKERAELEAMDDKLADADPVESERKLREFVASHQGLESRIGLVERSHAHDMAIATRTLPDDDPRGLPR